MKETFVPFRGIKNDLEGRLLCYKQDWTGCFRAGFRILAPTTYIFFASVIPVISFGEQLERNTNGSITAVQTLASTAICGVRYSIIGGLPLLILGVAEVTVLMYTFMFNFAKDKQNLGEKFFLPWTGWGNYLGCFIAMLFMQQAIKGVVDEFRIPQREDPNAAALSLSWRFGNGMFALVLSFGFLLTALKSSKARSWRYGTETSKYDDDQMLKSCGIKTDSKSTQVKGRVLSDPKLKVGVREDFFPRNEWWNFNRKKLVEPTRVNDQYLINIFLKINGNVGGWTQGYDGLTFVSVRGAGHEVPLHRPQLSLVLVKAFLSETAMPTMPQVITDY
ncbi:hypothetical protein GIB67_036790 [Kingdonia uniflora]|uniref:Bicarbonate transporter-like transmembrane domain-containing protein n=1 Tax=Kingdonia uniflora TaxID=39325 RepID=A0A7J7LWN3_9MAGN|nr:hypothetical protein GIB67_036790 [Kingdonia uniflora]